MSAYRRRPYTPPAMLWVEHWKRFAAILDPEGPVEIAATDMFDEARRIFLTQVPWYVSLYERAHGSNFRMWRWRARRAASETVPPSRAK